MNRRNLILSSLVLTGASVNKGLAQEMPSVIILEGHEPLLEREWVDEFQFTWRVEELPSRTPLMREFLFMSTAYKENVPDFPNDLRYCYMIIILDRQLSEKGMLEEINKYLKRFEEIQAQVQGKHIKELA